MSRPDWQDDAVDSYFQKVLNTDKAPPKGYNPYGRGYPDVSALASNYEVAVGGKLVGVSGTSASAPVVAGMISLINSARLAVGKSSVGWINPVLYSNYNSFTRDVKDGGNFCVASNSVCCRQGFHAATGWDPVTGLGSIHYPSLKSVFMSLGDNIDVPTESPTVLPGQPTTQPVSSPTKSPTVTPTVSPTSAAGWIVVSDYSSTECKGTVTDLIGIPSGLCQLEYDSTTRTEIIGSRLYYCTDCKYS